MIRCNNANNKKYKNKIAVNCKNGWVIYVDDVKVQINNDIYDKLKNFDELIYWSDDKCDYWVSDFQIDEIWFDVERISNLNNKELFMSTYKI